MHVLVTGANGYIGRRLVASLLAKGHRVLALVRDPRRFVYRSQDHPGLQVLEGDLLKPASLPTSPDDIDAAYYLVHSMGSEKRDFKAMEETCARHFLDWLERSNTRQIIYLSGIVNDRNLSRHLASRQSVAQVLASSRFPLTVLRSAIIIGSGSASFEIIRDLTEKLPIMITPKWVQTRCQPIAIADVLFYLTEVLLHPKAIGVSVDIGGPDVLSYRDMLLGYARVRGLKRHILDVPVMTVRLSSYWLYFLTSTSYPLARSLVQSMRNEVICGPHTIDTILDHQCLSFEEALRRAFDRIETNQVLSSWKDSVVSGRLQHNYLDFVEVPGHGVFRDVQEIPIDGDIDQVRDRVWSIGGNRGWYYMDWAWKLRGFLDNLMGGVGLRRGRRTPTDLVIGDAVDFWRVLLADDQRNQLVLFAEMKLPGEAWLAFEIDEEGANPRLRQTATFRPMGILGRLYWIALVPIHFFIFKGLCRRLARGSKSPHRHD